MGVLSSILEGKADKTIHAVRSDATTFDAVARMCRARVGALLVVDDEVPVGIISERDIMTRLLLERRDPSTTRVGDVMSKELVCIDLDAELSEAMATMTTRRCRHLPVVQEGSIVGMVSIGDLVHWAMINQEYEIRTLTEYVSGAYTHA